MTGCLVYFVLTLFAACKGWQCWSNSCGFSLMGMLSVSIKDIYIYLLNLAKASEH